MEPHARQYRIAVAFIAQRMWLLSAVFFFILAFTSKRITARPLLFWGGGG